MKTVFIGSTSRDLADYRQAAIETCLRLRLSPIAMEYFEAMPLGATRGSKQQLDRADLYVGIFAHRYGYIEDGYDKSVTETEFDYAGEQGIDRLCFLVDPQYPWPIDAIDFENQSRLKAFKDQLDKTLIRDQFTDVNDFKAKLTQALAVWVIDAPNEPPLPITTSVAPPRPTLVVGREYDVNNFKARLITPAETGGMTIIRGWPGVGKTTLVTALAYDDDIRKAFRDGVLWAHLGENPNPFSELVAWGRALGVPHIGNTLEEAIARMRTFLQHKRVLLIVDDIWKAEDAAAFHVAGPQCAMLITTRFGDVARQLAPTPQDVYLLDHLTNEQGLDLLNKLAPTVVGLYPDASKRLVSDLEGLPLALRVAARLLESEVSAGFDVGESFVKLSESADLLKATAPDDRVDPHTGTTPTVILLLKQSTDHLDDYTRDCFAFLGAFAPKPATFDLSAMKAVWMVDDPKPIVLQLIDRGLLEPIPAIGRFWMHAVLVLHAKAMLEGEG